jgi:diaminohydroxyphosphoribosylaminopyrimidine deaminase/5-amino-6-(5-phosphoribosylamino)uracil reductase
MFDAVLVGAGTIKADDPRLTTRLVRVRDPDVIILDGKFTVSSRARVFRTGKGRRIFLCVDKRYMRDQTQKALLLESRGVRVLGFHAKSGLLDIREVLADLYPHRVGSILVEGGSVVFAGFLNAGVVDELSVFVSPVLLGEGVYPFAPMRQTHRIARPYRIAAARQVGGDLLYTLRFREGNTRGVYRHH